MSFDQPRSTSANLARGPHWIALCAAVFTLPLLYVGGSVTTYRVGLAVPDWPTTFGDNMFLYDFWNAPFGVRIEHAHRLYGAAVGMATILLAGWLLVFERRRWMKALGVLAVVAVIVQGVLGGTRVTEVSTFLAAVHGCMGQAFFALMVALCVMTGRGWQAQRGTVPDTSHLRRSALLVAGLVAAQITLGSWLRHYGTPAALASHGALGAAVWAYAAVVLVKIERRRGSVGPLLPSARALAATSTLQIVLGVAATVMLLPFDGLPRPVSLSQALVRTGHQTNGALLLAATVVLTLRSFRWFAGSVPNPTWERGQDSSRHAGETALEWEAVA
jgi:cytochrome c oxidase assembly protein subunit 15